MKAFDEIYYIDSRKPEAEENLALRLSQLLARILCLRFISVSGATV